jgi:murein DD-endopeptidase MepM/ murein hydrolase activator NlpD
VRHVTLIVALVACGASAPVAGQGEPVVTVSVASRAVQPGDVALITVAASRPLVSVEGEALGRPVRFWPLAGSFEWQGLVGASLEAKPGSYDVVARGTDAGGAVASGKAPLEVEAKRFETRRLKVQPQFVNPPAAEAERIARDATLLANVLAQTTDRLWRGPFERPVPGQATSSFGRLTVLNGEPRGRHQGADFRAASGTPVLAPNAGRVVLAEDLYFSGNTVVLDHGLGTFSLFAHLSRIGVSLGATVARGELLGESGATGRVTGPHLHWALRLGEVSIDPLQLMATLSGLSETTTEAPPR